MIGGGAVSRRELAHVALEALADERALALTLAEGRTPAADKLPAIDSSRDAAIQDLGLVMYRRSARPLQPPGASRPTRLQSNEIRRAALAQATAQAGRRGAQAVRVTYQRLLASQGQPGWMLIIGALEWLAIIDRDVRQVIPGL